MKRMIKYLLVTGVWLVSMAQFHSSAEDRDPREHWGRELNGIKSGIQIHGHGWAPTTLSLMLTNVTERHSAGEYYLPFDQAERFAITVWDEEGAKIPLTDEGRQLGQPLQKNLNIDQWPHRKARKAAPRAIPVGYLKVLAGGPSTPLDLVHLEKYVIIDHGSKREYKIQFEQRLYKKTTSGLMIPTYLPPVEFKIVVQPKATKAPTSR